MHNRSSSRSGLKKVTEKLSWGIWHGYITHVPSYERRYLNNLSGIEDFILPYLEGMGVKLGIRWRIRRWLNRLAG
jgi:hypothetical protein